MHRPRSFLVRSLVVAVASLTAAAAVPLLASAASAGSNAAAVPAVVTTTTTTVPPNLAAVHVKLAVFASGLDSPVAVAFRAGDSRMYVAEQTGKVVLVSNGHVVSTVLNLSPYVSHGTEQGLLGVTFSLDGTKMYVDYTNAAGDTHVTEWTMAGDHANLATQRPILFQKQPFANHNGGEVMIGADGMLYIGLGDGGSAGDPQGNGQNLNTWLGKILRIDPTPHGASPYAIPPDNPFVGRAGVKPEIWMWGLRNPWRFSIDRVTHDTWIGDVGQALYEEIDYAKAGQSGINWGWNKREGLHPYNGGAQPVGARNPILERAHSLGDCAIDGGYVYRSHTIASLNGAYVFGDYCTGEIRAVVQKNGVVTQSRDLGLNVTQLSSFGEGPGGGIFALSHTGTIYVLLPA